MVKTFISHKRQTILTILTEEAFNEFILQYLNMG